MRIALRPIVAYLGTAVAALTAALIIGCATQGGEVTNPPGRLGLVGSLRTAEGGIASGARVQLFPTDYDPVAERELTTRPILEETTDSAGRYAFEALDSGTFNLWIHRPQDGTRLLLRGLRPESTAPATPRIDTLAIPGAISLPVPDSLPAGHAYIYLAGTPLSAPLDAAARFVGRVILDSVPIGHAPPIFRKVEGERGPGLLLAEDVKVRSGDTVPVLLAWKHSKRLYLRTASLGRGLNIRNFPLLVRLDPDNFDFARARTDGADIRFTDNAGRLLPFELELWDRTSSRAAFWVGFDSLKGPDTVRSFRIHWGHSEATHASAPRAVFDSSNQWAGVWHLAGFGLGVPPVLEDASVAGNAAQAGEFPGGAEHIPTPLGNGIALNGHPSLLFTSRRFDNPGDMTLSLWFRTTTDSGGLLLGFAGLQMASDSTLERDRHVWMDDSGRVHFGIYMNGLPADQSKRVLSTASPSNDGKWHHLAATLSSAGAARGMFLYLDGVKVAEDSAAGPAQDYAGWWRMGFTHRFGDWPFPPSGRYFKGDLDEVRVALRGLPVDWLRLSFETQREGSPILVPEPD